jgi:hypothetical protein
MCKKLAHKNILYFRYIAIPSGAKLTTNNARSFSISSSEPMSYRPMLYICTSEGFKRDRDERVLLRAPQILVR